jgi:pimeloyl-ACP methyl ester carboxylesterase
MRRLAAIVVAGALLVYGSISVYAANEFTRTERHPPDVAAAAAVGVAYEDVSFRSSDGKLLRGWLFPRGDRAVVMVHGKDGRRLDGECTVALARALTANGYTVLALDLRGHGESQGDRFSLGEYERLDVAAAVGFLEQRGIAASRIALFGESMGAGTVIQTLIVRPDVGAVVADSSYASADVVVQEQVAHETGLPSFFAPGILLAARAFGLDAEQAEPVAVVRAHPEKAFLFIHCDADQIVYLHHARELRAASANPDSQLWIVSGCAHVRAHDAQPAAYEALVLSFLDAQLR